MCSVFISLDLFQASLFKNYSHSCGRVSKSKIEVDSKESAKGKGNYGVLAARNPM
jgi:hypothetical protein